MAMKERYLKPSLDIISLETIRETMQVPSLLAAICLGDNLGDPVDAGEWSDLFEDL